MQPAYFAVSFFLRETTTKKRGKKMDTMTQATCSRCGVIVELGDDLNGVERYFSLTGTGFCGPRGRLNHQVA